MTTKKQLNGTDKQIAWAEDIRANAEKNLRAVYADRIAQCEEHIADPRPTTIRSRRAGAEPKVIRTAEQNLERDRQELAKLNDELAAAIDTLYSIASAKTFIDHRSWGIISNVGVCSSVADDMKRIQSGRLAF